MCPLTEIENGLQSLHAQHNVENDANKLAETTATTGLTKLRNENEIGGFLLLHA